ncbi:MAG TPA: hypothetical protein VIO32_01125 [Candidatus Baltobacteraceae bacterium]
MKRSLPLWIAAVVPAALVGHGLAYSLAGHSASGAQHAWVAPALECSFAMLAALCCALTADALLKAGILAHTAAERSVVELWPRLAAGQLLVFAVMERLEGSHATLAGSLVQLCVALVVAYVLSMFSHLLVRCVIVAEQASQYLERLARVPVPLLLSTQPQCAAYALAVHAGRARFKRPPPVL